MDGGSPRRRARRHGPGPRRGARSPGAPPRTGRSASAPLRTGPGPLRLTSGGDPRSQPVDGGDTDDRGTGGVRGGEVDVGADGPVVVAGGVVEDLADGPAAGLVVDHDQGGAAGVGSRADVGVVGEV